MWSPTSASSIIVLIGAKLHRALYPKRLALLAAALGISVNTASIDSMPMNIIWTDTLLVILVSLSIVIDYELMNSLRGD